MGCSSGGREPGGRAWPAVSCGPGADATSPSPRALPASPQFPRRRSPRCRLTPPRRAGQDEAPPGRAGSPTPSAHPPRRPRAQRDRPRSEEHTSELQSLITISYAVFCLKKKKKKKKQNKKNQKKSNKKKKKKNKKK